jgi:hypothetical protein
MRHYLFLLAVTALGCEGGTAPTGVPGAQLPLPRNLVFQAEAAGTYASDLGVHCTITTHIALSEGAERTSSLVVQVGTAGGDATRSVEKANGNVVQFWAHTYFADLRVRLVGSDSIEIRSPLSEASAERFWHEFSLFAGNTRRMVGDSEVLARGSWMCHPMDTPPSSGEYYDAEGSVPGTWVLMNEVP